MQEVDRRLWLTADRSRVVEDGDSDAAFLFAAGPGDRVPLTDARRYGLLEAKNIARPSASAEVEPETPREPQTEDKAIRGPLQPKRGPRR